LLSKARSLFETGPEVINFCFIEFFSTGRARVVVTRLMK
jgi:hypothetical protein